MEKRTIDAFDSLLNEAITGAIPDPDSKICVWCSGGLDSSTLLYYLIPYDVTGIHVYFHPDDPTVPLFNGLIEDLGVPGHSVLMSLADHFILLPEALRNHTGKMSAFPTMLLFMAMMSREYDLILHGLGLDELVGGYRQHAQAQDDEFYDVEQYYFDVLPERQHNTEIQARALGLDIRAPFIDEGLREFSDSLPRNYKTSGHFTKLILRELMKGRIPKANRMAGAVAGTKGGFHPPIREWWAMGLRPWVEDHLNFIDRLQTGRNLWKMIIRANQKEKRDLYG